MGNTKMRMNNFVIKPLAAAIALSISVDVAIAAESNEVQGAAMEKKVESKNLELETIVVTSQRRVQTLQEVPISVTAFSSEALEKGGIVEARDYLSQTPNVSFSEDGGAGSRSVNISVRGVSNVGLGEVVTANSIGFYIDELNVGSVSTGTINPQLQDMQRIEVLRGPQGTYFGRNSLGGALNISTKLPDEELYGEVSVNAASFGTLGGEGIFNLPISDKLMMRAVYSYNESDGEVENINPDGSDLGYEHTSGRIALRALPTDELTIDLSVTYTNEDEGGDITVPTGVINLDSQSIFGSDFKAIDELPSYPQNDSKVNRNLVELNDNEFSIVNLRVAYDFDGFEFKSITGLIDSSTSRAFDLDSTSVDALRRFNEYEATSFSQELRLQSTAVQEFDWTVGLFYAEDDIEQFNSIQAGADTSYTNPNTGEVIGLLPPIPAGFRINENNRVFKTESIALFGETVWHMNEQWDLTLGARYTQDDVKNEAFDRFAFESPVLDSKGDVSFNDFSPKVVVKYTASDDLNIYASVSQGYKSGGIDFSNDGSEASNFKPEELSSYEIGFKSSLLDSRVNLSAALFYLDWTNLQVQSNFLRVPGDISSAVEKTLNAAEVSATGVEFELTALLSEGLIASFSGGYLNSEFDSFDNAIIKGTTTPVSLSGESLPNTPELTLSGSLDYTYPVGDSGMEGFVRAEWNYRDESASNLEAVASNAGLLDLPAFPYQIDSYNVVNLRVGLRNDNFRINAYVENLFDEQYYTGTGDGFGLSGIRVKPHSTVLGVKFTYMM